MSRLTNTFINLGATFCHNLVLMLPIDPVIPAPYQVRGKLQQESSFFSGFWTPAFAGVTSSCGNKPAGSL